MNIPNTSQETSVPIMNQASIVESLENARESAIIHSVANKHNKMKLRLLRMVLFLFFNNTMRLNKIPAA